MTLNVAVQMDPIERINIAGDSTFALLLEAQTARPRALPITRPTGSRCATARCSRRCSRSRCATSRATISPWASRRASSSPTFDVVLLRQDPPFDLAYITTHASARAHPSQDAGGQRSGAGAQRAGKDLRHGISRPDAADADHPRPRRDQGVPRRARRHRDEAALRQWRRGGVPARRGRTSISARSTICSPSPSASSGWCRNSCRRCSDGDKRIILVDGEFAGAVNRVPAADDLRSNMVRGGAPKETDLTRARARDLRRASARRCASAG